MYITVVHVLISLSMVVLSIRESVYLLNNVLCHMTFTSYMNITCTSILVYGGVYLVGISIGYSCVLQYTVCGVMAATRKLLVHHCKTIVQTLSLFATN